MDFCYEIVHLYVTTVSSFLGHSSSFQQNDPILVSILSFWMLFLRLLLLPVSPVLVPLGVLSWISLSRLSYWLFSTCNSRSTLPHSPLFSTLHCAQGSSMEPQGVCLPLGFIKDLANGKPKGRGWEEREVIRCVQALFLRGRGLAVAVFLHRTLQVLLGSSPCSYIHRFSFHLSMFLPWLPQA